MKLYKYRNYFYRNLVFAVTATTLTIAITRTNYAIGPNSGTAVLFGGVVVTVDGMTRSPLPIPILLVSGKPLLIIDFILISIL